MVSEFTLRVIDQNARVGLALEGAIGDGPAEPVAPPVAIGVAQAGVAVDRAEVLLALVGDPQRVVQVISIDLCTAVVSRDVVGGVTPGCDPS